ncbi:hypothetical protein [Janthinobacterium sp. HLX7-2]|uniref:hypothetical protein n=1 Tax=Janthinobacterium sp. HLX7-2 TaxID=1259331 RepID=UPI003F23C26A
MPAIHSASRTIQPPRSTAASLCLAVGSATLLSLSACANLHTINRSTDLPGNGKAIHLDAAQRVMHVTSDGKACAEPTPDALQSYISSFGGAFSAGPDGASVSNALSANAASVGLHSQSITLMRQQLFNICEYAQNKWLNDADVMLLMERSQDLTLGVLAIEQLTGAVVARQAALTGHAGSTAQNRLKASTAALATQAQLDLAIKKEEAMQGNLDALRPTMPTVPAAGKGVAANRQAIMLKTAQDGVSSAATDSGADTTLSDASAALAQAQAERATLEEQLADNLTQSKASARGTSDMAGPLPGTTINEGTAAHLAKASTEIVKMVLNKSHLTDMCITFMNHPKKHPETGLHYKNVMEQCKAVLAAEIRTGTTAAPYFYPSSGPIDEGINASAAPANDKPASRTAPRGSNARDSSGDSRQQPGLPSS